MLKPNHPPQKRKGRHGKKEKLHQGLTEHVLEGKSNRKRRLFPQARKCHFFGCSHSVQRVQRSGHFEAAKLHVDTHSEKLHVDTHSEKADSRTTVLLTGGGPA